MKLVFEDGFAYVPPYTPWSLVIEKSHQDPDLVLHIGSCLPITVLRGSEMRAAYNTNQSSLTGAYSEIIDQVNHCFEHGDIDLEILAESVFCNWEESSLEVGENDQSLPTSLPMWNGYSSAYVWSIILQHLRERFGENVIHTWFNDTIPRFTQRNLVICARNDFYKEVLTRRCVRPIQAILDQEFQLKTEIEVVSVDDYSP